MLRSISSAAGRRSRLVKPQGCSEQIALQELDHFTIRTSNEGDLNLGPRLTTKLPLSWRDTRHCACRQRSRIGRIHVRNAEAEMQQRSFRRFLVGAAAAALRLNCGTRPEHLNETAVAHIEKRGAIDPPGH